MRSYPKIDTLYVRDQATHVLTKEYRHPVYSQLKGWHVEEKIDGTNCRIIFKPDGPTEGWDKVDVQVAGRTDRATLHPNLQRTLMDVADRVLFEHYDEFREAAEGAHVLTLYGEGVGPKVQGNVYNLPEHQFLLFDIKAGDDSERGWFPPSAVHDVGKALGVTCVPVLSTNETLSRAEGLARHGFVSFIRAPIIAGMTEPALSASYGDNTGRAESAVWAEGVVCKARVPLYDARRRRVMLKLKRKDFRVGQ